MQRGQLFVGAALVFFGALFLVSNLLGINVWTVCWPVAIILVGVWLLFRPKFAFWGWTTRYRLIGDIRRSGGWQVQDQEIWIGVGDVELDMLEADVPPGETKISVLGFVGEVELFVPQDVGVSVYSTAFVTDARFMGYKQENFLVPFEHKSADYENAERKIHLQTTFFVADVKVKRV